MARWRFEGEVDGLQKPALAIEAVSPQHSEDYERKARREERAQRPKTDRRQLKSDNREFLFINYIFLQ